MTYPQIGTYPLTFETAGIYAESLKTTLPAFTPRQSVFFMPMAWTRAENNQYQPKLCNVAFSESTPLSFLVALLRKTLQMTNTNESTLQSLYRYYSEIKSTWYKGEYTIDQEDIYAAVFSAIEKALIKLPMQTPEDRKIKIAMLKNMVLFACETNGGYDLSAAPNMECESLELIEQLMKE